MVKIPKVVHKSNVEGSPGHSCEINFVDGRVHALWVNDDRKTLQPSTKVSVVDTGDGWRVQVSDGDDIKVDKKVSQLTRTELFLDYD